MTDNSAATLYGVVVTPLRRIVDARGSVMRMLRADSPVFRSFGEIYFSTVRPGVIKAWKRHRRMTLNLTVPVGLVRAAAYDDRPDSPTRGMTATWLLTPDDHRLLTVPPGLWFGFQGLGEGESLIANCPDIPHDPDEADNLPADDPAVPYDWRDDWRAPFPSGGAAARSDAPSDAP